ncbi:hypothetical protein DEF28_18495 [Marinitenerispora sediminis]|uniref:Uncharacterized protein n=1 Tax=Marinitenerispora sediminis TaxID=1931232 RepID=A0A368T7U0_9ACTN|nr:hypothetical protein DEF28_18495 [Marinitenerispora sediminis]RCV58044.1 hypothetical protein DEF24_14175 [Marinitenerispora sediminis]
MAAAGLYRMNATSQPTHLRNQERPISVFVKDAVRGSTPANTTSMPIRTTINIICMRLKQSATRPRTMIINGSTSETAPEAVPTTNRTVMFSAKSRPPIAPSRIHSENASEASTARLMKVSPAPETTTRVNSDFTSSLPGSARCSQAIFAPPMITETTAAAPMYHQRLFCR